jgi:hypothetical protein
MSNPVPKGVPVTRTSDSSAIPPTAAEASDEFVESTISPETAEGFDEPTLPPEAAPLLAAAGVQALAVKLLRPRLLGGVLAGVLSMVLVSFARRALTDRRGD